MEKNIMHWVGNQNGYDFYIGIDDGSKKLYNIIPEKEYPQKNPPFAGYYNPIYITIIKGFKTFPFDLPEPSPPPPKQAIDPKDFKVHAAYTISNAGGIELMLDRRGDGVYYRFNYGQDNLDQEDIFEAEIQYEVPEDQMDSDDAESIAYFIHQPVDGEPTKYYLNEFIRIDR